MTELEPPASTSFRRGRDASDLRMDYTAVGQTTHLAARMEQLAAPGGIRLTAETLRLAEGFVQVPMMSHRRDTPASLDPAPI